MCGGPEVRDMGDLQRPVRPPFDGPSRPLVEELPESGSRDGAFQRIFARFLRGRSGRRRGRRRRRNAPGRRHARGRDGRRDAPRRTGFFHDPRRDDDIVGPCGRRGRRLGRGGKGRNGQGCGVRRRGLLQDVEPGGNRRGNGAEREKDGHKTGLSPSRPIGRSLRQDLGRIGSNTLEGVGELPRGGESPVTVLFESAQHYAREGGAGPRVESRGFEGRRRAVEMLAEIPLRSLRLKGRLPCQHLVEHDAERVDVAPAVHELTRGERSRLFGRAVLQLAHEEARARHRQGLRRHPLGDAEIDDLGEQAAVPALPDEDIVGRDVAVNDPLGVDLREAGQDLARDVQGLRGGNRPVPAHPFLERHAVDELPDHVERAVRQA